MEIKSSEYEEKFNELTVRLGKAFANELGFENMRKYVRGLLGNAERKNGWQLSEYLGVSTPYALQQFIYRGRYSADSLRDEMRDYVIEELGEAEGVLVPDETGFLKQGKKSCGVMRQYSGTAGRIENCQIGVFMTYASPKGHSVIDRRLYIPKEWLDDAKRRVEAGIPETVGFQTKPQMALEMIHEATTAGVPYRWVTGDCVYGDYTDIRMYLEEHKKCYVMNVSGKAYVWRGYKQSSVGNILKSLPESDWFEASCGNGSKGDRLYDWLALPINPGTTEGFERSLLIRRSQSSPDELRAYICFAPVGTPKQKLAEVAGTRWTVETSFKESKGEVGLDQYEVRSYDGWYRHITFACIALAFLTVLSCRSFDTKPFQQHNPASSSLDDFKRGRNLHV
jgi:SRSO17 transposase